MRRVWATVAAVWAMLLIVAVLAWMRAPAARPAAQPAPTAVLVPGKNGASHVVLLQPAAAAHATTQTSPPPPA